MSNVNIGMIPQPQPDPRVEALAAALYDTPHWQLNDPPYDRNDVYENRHRFAKHLLSHLTDACWRLRKDEGLDVERLARAIAEVYGWEPNLRDTEADKIAAAYLLHEPSREPGEERHEDGRLVHFDPEEYAEDGSNDEAETLVPSREPGR